MDFIDYLQQMFRIALAGDIQGIWFWASIYAFAACGYSLWFQVRTRFWPCTRGTLNQLATKKFGATEWVASNQEYKNEALYSYSVAGKAYQGTRISPWKFVASHNARFLLEKQNAAIQPASDGTVKVFYNPKNPRQSYLIVAGSAGICITLLLGTLPFVFYWMRYHG